MIPIASNRYRWTRALARDQRGVLFVIGTILTIGIIIGLLAVINSMAPRTRTDLQYISAADRASDLFTASDIAFNDIFDTAGINVTVEAFRPDGHAVTFTERLASIDVYQPTYLNITLEDEGGIYAEPHIIDYRSDEQLTVRVRAFGAFHDPIHLLNAHTDLLRVSEGEEGITCRLRAGSTTWYDHGDDIFDSIDADIPMGLESGGSCLGRIPAQDLVDHSPDDQTTLVISVIVGGYRLTDTVAIAEVEVRPIIIRCDHYKECAECTQDTYSAGNCTWDVHTGRCGDSICVPASDFCETESERHCTQFSPAQTMDILYGNVALFSRDDWYQIPLTHPLGYVITTVLDLSRVTGDIPTLTAASVSYSGAINADQALTKTGNATWEAAAAGSKTGRVHYYAETSEYRAAYWPKTAEFLTDPGSLAKSNLYVGPVTETDQPCYMNITITDQGGTYADPYTLDWLANEAFGITVSTYNCLGQLMDASAINLVAEFTEDATTWYDHGLGEFRKPASAHTIPVSGMEHIEVIPIQDIMPYNPDQPTTIALVVEVSKSARQPVRSVVELVVLPLPPPTACADYDTCTLCTRDGYHLGSCVWDGSLGTPACGELLCDPAQETCVAESESGSCPVPVPTDDLAIGGYNGLVATANIGGDTDFQLTRGEAATFVLDTTQMNAALEEGATTTVKATLDRGWVPLAMDERAAGIMAAEAEVTATDDMYYHVLTTSFRAADWPYGRDYTGQGQELAWGVALVGEGAATDQPCYAKIEVHDAGGVNTDPYVLDWATNEQFTIRVTPYDCAQAALDPTAAGLYARLLKTPSTWYDYQQNRFKGLTATRDVPISGGYFEATVPIQDIVGSNPATQTSLVLAVEVGGGTFEPIRQIVELTVLPAPPPTACTGYLTCTGCTNDTYEVGTCTWDASLGTPACGAVSCDGALDTCFNETEGGLCPSLSPALRLGLAEREGAGLTVDAREAVSFAITSGEVVELVLDLSQTEFEVEFGGTVTANLQGTVHGTFAMSDNGDGTWSMSTTTSGSGGSTYEIDVTSLTAPSWNGTRDYTTQGEHLVGGMFYVGAVLDSLQPVFLNVSMLEEGYPTYVPHVLAYSANETFVLRVEAYNGTEGWINATGTGLAATLLAATTSWYDHGEEEWVVRELASDIDIPLLTNGTFEVPLGIGDLLGNNPNGTTNLILSVEVDGTGFDPVRSLVDVTVHPVPLPVACSNYDSCYACTTDPFSLGACMWDLREDPPVCGDAICKEVRDSCIREPNVTGCPVMNVSGELYLGDNNGFATTLEPDGDPVSTFYPATYHPGTQGFLHGDTTEVNGTMEAGAMLTAHLDGAIKEDYILFPSGDNTWARRIDIGGTRWDTGHGRIHFTVSTSGYQAPLWARPRPFPESEPLMEANFFGDPNLEAVRIREQHDRLLFYLQEIPDLEVDANLTLTKEKMALIVHPVNLWYDHLAYGGGVASFVPLGGIDKVRGYAINVHLPMEKRGRVEWPYAPAGDLPLTITITDYTGAVYTETKYVNPELDTVMNADLSGQPPGILHFLLGDGGRLVFINRADSNVVASSTVYLDPLDEHQIPWVTYEEDTLYVWHPLLNATRNHTVTVTYPG